MKIIKNSGSKFIARHMNALAGVKRLRYRSTSHVFLLTCSVSGYTMVILYLCCKDVFMFCLLSSTSPDNSRVHMDYVNAHSAGEEANNREWIFQTERTCPCQQA